MNFKERAAVTQYLLDKYSYPVMRDKGAEYSRGEENCNSNFFRVGDALGRTPMEAAWTYALKHIDSVSNWVKNGCPPNPPSGEPMEGRMGDIINYVLILYSISVQLGYLDHPLQENVPPGMKLELSTQTPPDFELETTEGESWSGTTKP